MITKLLVSVVFLLVFVLIPCMVFIVLNEDLGNDTGNGN